MNRELIEQYATGGHKIEQAIAGLTPDELLATPIPGKWSMHVLVIHLADAEAAFADRIRRIISTDNPTLLAWDEAKFLSQLHYTDQSVEDAIILINTTRRQMARVLRKLPDDAFQRIGQHSERGPQTLVQVLTFANYHLDHHMKFAAEKREKLGKEVAKV